MSINCTEFINWLINEVMDEENWYWNSNADGEIICRKLRELGILDTKDECYYEVNPVIRVRCKDCDNYCTEIKDINKGYGYCDIHNSVVSEDDFCSYGEGDDYEW